VKETLEIINAIQRDGVIGKYAIGGAVGRRFISNRLQRLTLTFL
jgi:hypothetical protein